MEEKLNQMKYLTDAILEHSLEAYSTTEKHTDSFCMHKALGVTLDALANLKESDGFMRVPPKGRHAFGMVKVGDKGQIVIPAKARRILDIKPGDNLLILGDEGSGLAILKEKDILNMLEISKSVDSADE